MLCRQGTRGNVFVTMFVRDHVWLPFAVRTEAKCTRTTALAWRAFRVQDNDQEFATQWS